MILVLLVVEWMRMGKPMKTEKSGAELCRSEKVAVLAKSVAGSEDRTMLREDVENVQSIARGDFSLRVHEADGRRFRPIQSYSITRS